MQYLSKKKKKKHFQTRETTSRGKWKYLKNKGTEKQEAESEQRGRILDFSIYEI